MGKDTSKGRSGNSYTAKVRRKYKTKIKKKKRWSFRRIASLIGFVAAFFAVISLINTAWSRRIIAELTSLYVWGLGLRATFNDFINQFIAISLPAPMLGLGDIILIAILITLFVLLLRVTEPTITRKIDEMIMQLKVKSEVTQKKEKGEPEAGAQTPPVPYVAYMPMGFPQQGTPERSRILQLSASAVVNAPRGKVWEVLNEVVYVPTCQELLESVEVLGKIANALTWEGKIRVGHKVFPVEGTTTMYPPTRMEVKCTRGALGGFEGVLSLSEVEGGTRLTETAEFDPSKIQDEYSPVANALSIRGSEILIGDLTYFDKLIKALLSPGDQEEVPP